MCLIETGRGRAIGITIGTIACCASVGMTVWGSYILALNPACELNNITCLKDRVEGIALTAIGVVAFVVSTVFCVAFAFFVSLNATYKWP